MKKLITLLVVAVMLMGCVSISFAAENKLVDEMTEYPIIFVPGFATSNLYYYDENGEEQPIWGTDPLGQITDNTEKDRLKILAAGAAEFLAKGDADALAKELNYGFTTIFAEFACTPDGQPVCETHNFLNAPAQTNYKYLTENYPDGKYQTEVDIAKALGKEIGLENIFVFHLDFRLGIVELASQLREYIDDVIDYCNESRSEKDKIDKVNLYGLSHGGQISGTYLTLYGHEGKVHNAALLMPALGGAALAYDVFGGAENFSDRVLLDFLEHGLVVEEEFDILFEAIRLGFIGELFRELVEECFGHVKYWESFWDFVPLDVYEEYKAKHLDSVESARLIEQSDFVHYEIMSPEGEFHYTKGFKKAEEAGTRIYIIAGYDIQAVTGMVESTDAIVPVAGATGATVAPFGQRFADGYTQEVDTGFYQVSPSMTVDASTSYLPERTWFIEKGYHGMALYDDYTITLLYKLLLNGGEAYDVHNLESQGYTQFHTTTNPSHIIFAEFDKSKEGYLSAEDKELVITNISYDSIVTVSAVNVKGADFDFEFFPFILKPGKSKSIKIDGEIPAVSLKNIEIDVTYLTNKVTPIGERTFDFTIMNGEKADFDGNNPFVNADYPDYLTGSFVEIVTEKIGVKKVTGYTFNIIAQIMRFFTKFMPF